MTPAPPKAHFDQASARILHKAVHRNLRTNSADPSSPLQKLTHTIQQLLASCILNLTDVWFGPLQCGLYSFRAQNKAGRLCPVDPGISRRVTDLYPPRGYTHPVTRAIEVSHSLQSWVLIKFLFGSSHTHSWSAFFHFLKQCTELLLWKIILLTLTTSRGVTDLYLSWGSNLQHARTTFRIFCATTEILRSISET